MQQQQGLNDVLIPLLRALAWTLLNCLFGLVQVWVVLFVAPLLSFHLSLADLVARGEALFFSMALTIGIALDYYFDPAALSLPKWILGILTVVVPALISVLSIATYMVIYLEAARVAPDKVMVFQNWILFGALTYSVCMKFLQFLAAKF